jgi:hypothetical protein
VRSLGVAAFLAVAGCSGADRAKAQAAHDFDCPQMKIEVQDLGDQRYQVNACHNIVVYRCAENAKRKKECLRDDR